MSLKVRIYTEPISQEICITFYDRNERGELFVVKPFNLTISKVEEGAFIEPTIRLPGYHGELGESLLFALAEALDKEGIKTDKDTKLAGMIEAMKTHLQDMRLIVYKQLGIEENKQ